MLLFFTIDVEKARMFDKDIFVSNQTNLNIWEHCELILWNWDGSDWKMDFMISGSNNFVDFCVGIAYG